MIIVNQLLHIYVEAGIQPRTILFSLKLQEAGVFGVKGLEVMEYFKLHVF